MVSAAPFCWLISAGYVGVLYLLPQTRPRKRHGANAVSEEMNSLKLRLVVVSIISFISVLLTLWILTEHCSIPYPTALHLVGLFPKESTFRHEHDGGVVSGAWMENFKAISGEALKVSLVTALLFLGPLFEYLYSKTRYCRYISPAQPGTHLYISVLRAVLTSWRQNLFCLQGARVYVVGPWTEEIVFRACLVGLTIGCGMVDGSNTTYSSLVRRAILVTPMYFSLAHAHHAYEAIATGESTVTMAIVMALFQCGFTGVFGVYAAFVYIRTGSILAPCCVHSFCNSIGLPRLTGRLIGPGWVTVVYYVLLFVGVILFSVNLMPLTQSSYGLLQ